MKSGITRRIDELGRIVVPKEMRYNLGIRDGEPLEISYLTAVCDFRKCATYRLKGNNRYGCGVVQILP